MVRTANAVMTGTAGGAVEARPQPVVLVVDDEAAICSTLTSVLADEGFETLVSNDGLDAVLKVQSFHPDVVLLDIWMPGSDGIETLGRIKAIAPDTEVVMMSGHATISNALDATKRGACDFIEKPLSIDNVLTAVGRALDRRNIGEPGAVDAGAGSTSGAASGRAGEQLSNFFHPGLSSLGASGANLGQRTLKQSAVLYGHCLHSGRKSGLVLEPLPANSGIQFAMMGDTRAVPAFVDFVESTDLATTLRSGGVAAATIEHLMAALSAYRITNLLVKCNGEVPIFDGSAREFCAVIESIGIEEQGGEWYELAIPERIEFRPERRQRVSGSVDQGEELILIEPSDHFAVRYELRYPAPVGNQSFEFTLNGPESFRDQIAPARTFGFMRDIERLQKAGLAAGGRLDNFILIGTDRVVNTELRFPEELARHKVLDLIGDLSLLGRPLRAKITARMTGHSDNINVLRTLRRFLQVSETAAAKRLSDEF